MAAPSLRPNTMHKQARVYRGLLIDVSTQKGAADVLRVSVPAKIVPKAVGRNKIKRWCREIWRKSGFKNKKEAAYEIGIKIKKAQNRTFQGLQEDFRKAESFLLSEW